MRWLLALGATMLATGMAASERDVTFPTDDGGLIHADEYGRGAHGVVLAHGGRFDRKSWKVQAEALAEAGYRVLALDFRGYGKSRGGEPTDDPYEGLPLDVLGAARHLRGSGARRISVIGGSMGGWAAAEAACLAEPGEIDDLVLLAHSAVERPERMQGRKLFITTRDDPFADGTPRLVKIREQYEKAPGPKELLILKGSAHAQHIFGTRQGERLLREILDFLEFLDAEK